MAVPRPQQGTAAENNNVGTLLRHTTVTDGARPKHSALARREYGLLAPTGTVFDPAAARYQVSGDDHEATRGTDNQAWRETEEGGGTRQHALPACGMQGAHDKYQRPP